MENKILIYLHVLAIWECQALVQQYQMRASSLRGHWICRVLSI